LIFAPPYNRVSTRIDFPVNVNWGVAVDPKTGIFAVALQSGNKGYVEFFRHGSQAPCAMVSDPSGSYWPRDLYLTPKVGYLRSMWR
jgi:hypothetical protein